VHLASPQVDLETHITDVVNLIEFEDLHEVVLLGHSYGGLVVTGAVDRIPEAHLLPGVPGHRAAS
jgi:pimeloyl-ACP methyl ester carboxylesterase